MPTLSALRGLREEQVLTIRELARRARISPASIVRAEKGKPVYPATVRKLAKALGVTPAVLRGPEPVTQGYAQPARPRSSPGVARALAEAERLRRADDLAGAARWEQIAAGMAQSLSD